MKRIIHLLKWLCIVPLAALLLAACNPGSEPTQEVATATEEVLVSTDVPTTVPTDTPEPTAIPRSATITLVEGTVEVSAAGSETASPASVGQVMNIGETLQTGDQSKAVIELEDETVIAVSANSSFRLEALDGTTESPISRFFLNLGQVFSLRGGALPEGASFQVETPDGVAMIRGSALGVSFTGEIGTRATCLIGTCGVIREGDPQWTQVPPGQSMEVANGEISEAAPMDAADMQEWNQALNAMEEAGVDTDEKLDSEGCSCDDTTYVCEDGTSIENFASCIEGQSCSCDGTTLTCDDGTSTANDPACIAPEGQNPASSCTCSGPHLYCDNGSVVYSAAACTGGIACGCVGPNLTCGDAVYPNDPSCTQDTSTCTCTDGFVICPNGGFSFNPAVCASQLPCVCQGTEMVCTEDGETFSFPHPACGGALPTFPDLPSFPDDSGGGDFGGGGDGG